MPNKYVTNPCILHHPRYICSGVKTKYVAKEGAENTTPHIKEKTTARVMNHAYIHIPRPYVHLSIDANTNIEAHARYMKTETRSR